MENFYPFISSNLFKESFEFSRQFIQISDDDLLIIMQARRKILLSQVTTPWIKNDTGDEGFSAPIGCFDGDLIGELVGTYTK